MKLKWTFANKIEGFGKRRRHDHSQNYLVSKAFITQEYFLKLFSNPCHWNARLSLIQKKLKGIREYMTRERYERIHGLSWRQHLSLIHTQTILLWIKPFFMIIHWFLALPSTPLTTNQLLYYLIHLFLFCSWGSSLLLLLIESVLRQINFGHVAIKLLAPQRHAKRLNCICPNEPD